MNAEVLLVFAEILQHMKDNNATLTAQNKLMRKQNETQKDTTQKLVEAKEAIRSVSTRIAVVGFAVVLSACVAGAAVFFNIQTAKKLDDTRAKINSAQTALNKNIEYAKEASERGKKLAARLEELADNIEEAPGIVVDDKGRAALDVKITEEQARRLKKPRRRASRSARAIQVKKPSEYSSVKKGKPRAIVPLEMGGW